MKLNFRRSVLTLITMLALFTESGCVAPTGFVGAAGRSSGGLCADTEEREARLQASQTIALNAADQTDPSPPPDDGLYYLPYPAGTSCFVAQGNFGVVGLGSHAGQYAIDFMMPEGSYVLAARAGTVVAVRQDCPDENCPFAPTTCCGNFIKVRHADGTVAAYWHLRQEGACVERGDIVAQGDVIGFSGNTGMSMAPHLHFSVLAAEGEGVGGSLGKSNDRSIEVWFADVPGDGVPQWLGTYESCNLIARDRCGP